MSRIKFSIYALAAYILLCLIFATVGSRQVQGQSGGGNGQASNKDVRVINTASEPVPVAGSVNATVNGSVQAQQSGAWSVGIASGANTVKIGNPTSAPVPGRDVDNPARQPFQMTATVFYNHGVAMNHPDLGSVPAGKHLVIEWIHLDSRLDFATFYGITTTVAGHPITYTLYAAPTGASLRGSPVSLGTYPVRIYADPGTTLSLDVSGVGDDTSHGTATASISGYLVDAP